MLALRNANKRDLLLPESLKYTVTCPGLPDGASPREQQDQAKQQRGPPRLGNGAQRFAAG